MLLNCVAIKPEVLIVKLLYVVCAAGKVKLAELLYSVVPPPALINVLITEAGKFTDASLMVPCPRSAYIPFVNL